MELLEPYIKLTEEQKQIQFLFCDRDGRRNPKMINFHHDAIIAPENVNIQLLSDRQILVQEIPLPEPPPPRVIKEKISSDKLIFMFIFCAAWLAFLYPFVLK
jgi:hypothetical protein